MFSSFSSFVDVNYIAMKKTVGSVTTTAIGCFINIVLNFIFIPRYGIYAAASTTLIAFAVTWFLRLKNTKGFVNLQVNYLKLIVVVGLILLQYVVLFLDIPLAVQLVFFAAVLLCHAKGIIPILSILKKRFLRKKSS